MCKVKKRFFPQKIEKMIFFHFLMMLSIMNFFRLQDCLYVLKDCVSYVLNHQPSNIEDNGKEQCVAFIGIHM